MTASFPTAEAIQDCRTIRQFKPNPVSEDLIAELLNVAALGPHPGRNEPWRFLLFVEEGKKTLTDAIIQNGVKKRDPDKLMRVPAYLMVVIKQSTTALDSDQNYATACTLIQNFRLTAWERGLGVSWMMKPYMYRQAFLETCGVMPDEKLVGLMQIGYPEVLPVAAQPTPVQQKWTVVRTIITTEANGYNHECSI